MKLFPLVLAMLAVGPGGWAAESATPTLSARGRFEPGRLQAAREAQQRFARERQELPALSAFEDFRAVIHVHAEDSNHTLGTREQVLAAAKKTGVRVVLFT